MDDCTHETIVDNNCIECGYTFDYTLVSYVTHIDTIKNGKLNYKYSLADNDFFITQYIKEILPNTPHLDEIKEIVMTKKFKKRTSTIDKIITASYYILKKNDCDVLKIDFVKYCKKGYYHFIKLLRDEFGYIRNTEKYIRNVIDRIYVYLEAREFKFDKSLIYKKVSEYEDIGCANLIDVALYFIFEDDLFDSFEYYDLDNFTYKSSLQRIRNQTMLKNTKKVTNAGLVKRIDRVLRHMNDIDQDHPLDNIDLYIEKKILKGEDVNKLKQMTMKQIKSEMQEYVVGGLSTEFDDKMIINI